MACISCAGANVGRTEGEDYAAALGDDTEGAVVLLPRGILDSGSEDTGGTGYQGALGAGLQGIDWVIAIVITMGRHVLGGVRVEGAMRSSMGDFDY